MNKIYQKHTPNHKISVKRNLAFFVTTLRTSFALPVRSGRCESRIRAGFTLIELLVVVLIIGILAAIALPKYQRAVDRSRWVSMLQMERTISRAQEMYYMANGQYAFNFEELGLDYPLEDERNFTHGQMHAVFYTEGGVPYIMLYQRKDTTSYENVYLLTFYYSSPKRVLRQCRPAYGVSGDEWKNLCSFLMGEGATIKGNGWYVIEE